MASMLGRKSRNVAAGIVLCLASALSLPVAAQTGGGGGTAPAAATGGGVDPAHVKEDISRHRTMSAAHAAAAQCLEAGRSEKECHAELRKACQGIAVGRYCGMRHSH
jgi:hypothetical protein